MTDTSLVAARPGLAATRDPAHRGTAVPVVEAHDRLPDGVVTHAQAPQ